MNVYGLHQKHIQEYELIFMNAFPAAQVVHLGELPKCTFKEMMFEVMGMQVILIGSLPIV